MSSEQKPPIERFEAWLAEGKNKQIVVTILKNLWGYYSNSVEVWSKKEFSEMRNWIITEPKKADKSLWGRFIRNWLTNSFNNTKKIKKEYGYVELIGQTNYQEKQHFQNKKREKNNGI